MTYSQMIKEIYRENRKWIRLYAVFCLVFSVFAFGGTSVSYAGYQPEMIATLGGSFGGMLLPLVMRYFEGIDVSFVMALMSGVSFALEKVPAETLLSLESTLGVNGLSQLTDYSFGLCDYNVFRVFFLAWFLVAKLAKSTHVSYTVAEILEYVETKMGMVPCVLNACIQFLHVLPSGMQVQATEVDVDISVYNVLSSGVYVLLCFLLLLCVPVIYILIRYFFFFLNILLIPICTVIPFLSLGIGAVKIGGLLVLMLLAIFQPYLCGVLLLLLLGIAIRVFRDAYITLRYFRNIYVRPLWKKINGDTRQMPLVEPKLPKKLKRYINVNEADIIMPVYIAKKIDGYKNMYWHDRWWFVLINGKQYICKPDFWKDTCYFVELREYFGKPVFIKKSLHFFEIFVLKGAEEEVGRAFKRVPKAIQLVFSKEYESRYEEIKRMTWFADYDEYVKQKRQDMKMAQQEKRGLKGMWGMDENMRK